MKKYFIVHPFLFALFPILFLFSHNIEQVYYSDILFLSALLLSIIFIIILLLKVILKNINKITIILSVFIVLFFSYGHIYNLIVNKYIGGFEFGRHRYLLITYGMVFILSSYHTIMTQKSLYNLTKILNFVSISLFVIPLLTIGRYEISMKNTGNESSHIIDDMEISHPNLRNTSILQGRDIYYIILDGYASSRTLFEIYNYNNQNFIESLIKKGFYVPRKSQSNYPLTHLSLASSLNMNYINYFSDIIGLESSDVTLPYQMIKNSKVMNYLKLKGYKFIHLSSGWGPTNRNRFADLDFHSWKGFEFLMVLAHSTINNPFFEKYIRNDLRKSKLNTFSKLADLSKIKDPKFIFAHIISPHPPFLFDINGEQVPHTGLSMFGDVWGDREKYLNQLIFINKKVEELIDQLLLRSLVPPIIILQADHGPASTFALNDSSDVYMPTDVTLKERMGIFNAYYLPLTNHELLYDSITPVNTFRLIFNLYFNSNYELLNDQSYWSSYYRPYDFNNVTDRLGYVMDTDSMDIWSSALP